VTDPEGVGQGLPRLASDDVMQSPTHCVGHARVVEDEELVSDLGVLGSQTHEERWLQLTKFFHGSASVEVDLCVQVRSFQT
jgi:DUF1680 family protein